MGCKVAKAAGGGRLSMVSGQQWVVPQDSGIKNQESHMKFDS
jgi:hypothetical protein